MVQGESRTVTVGSRSMVDGRPADQQFEDYEVAKVSGKVHVGANMSIPVLELPIKDEETAIAEASNGVNTVVKTEDGEAMNVDGDAVDKPVVERKVTTAAAMRHEPVSLPQTLFIGDLRLTSLKTRLSGMSIPAEFAGEGMLICGPGVPTLLKGEKLGPGMGSSVVAVRKTGEGKIEMEGSVGDVYYHVRDALYGNFAQVVM